MEIGDRPLDPQTSQVAFVTGAAGGLGSEIARQLVACGYTVFAADIDAAALGALSHPGIRTVQLDVTDEASVKSAVDAAIAQTGRIDLLVNNAALPQAGVIETTPVETIRRLFDVNVIGYARMQAAVLPHMRARRSGHVINISSAIGKVPMPGFGWYSATKHAIEGMSDALRMEVEPLGIKVSIIEPGLIATPFIARQSGSISQVPHSEDYKRIEKYASGFGMKGQGSTGAEIAAAVVKVATAAKPPARLALPRSVRVMILMRRFLGDRFLFGSLLRGLKLR